MEKSEGSARTADVGVIGAGKVGRAVGRYLAARGCRIAGFASRSRASAEAGCAELGGDALDPVLLARRCDAVCVAVPDDAIAPLAAQLAAAGGYRAGAVWIHFSGALPSDALAPLGDTGGRFSLHPIYPFADRNVSAAELEKAPFTAEGSGDGRFVRRYFPGAVWIDASRKAAYHASLCVASNFLVTLLREARRILEPLGIDASVCRPLIEKTVDNALGGDAQNALTGPIARGDAGTVAAHLASLAPNDDFYRAMARFTARDARLCGQIDAAAYYQIMEVLNDGKGYDTHATEDEEQRGADRDADRVRLPDRAVARRGRNRRDPRRRLARPRRAGL